MKELCHYDKAANEFYGSQYIKSLPLSSWDFYADYFDVFLRCSEDMEALKKLGTANRWHTPLKIKEELLQKRHVVVVTDVHLKIVHASHNMREMNGYSFEEVAGKNPKIFQGKETCPKTSQYISNAIKTRKPFEATVINYRKDGSPYKCWIKAQPIFNSDQEVVHFIAYEKEVA